MSDFLHDPSRWKDHTDQVRLSERAAGQMVRGLGTAEPLSGVQLARIAARVRAQRSRPRRLRLWVPVTAVLLFGGVAAASAAHMDLLPGWLIAMVRPGAGTSAPRMPGPRTPRIRPSSPAPSPARPAPIPSAAPAAAEQDPPALPPALSTQEAAVARPNPSEHAREPIRRAVPKPPETRPLQPVPAKASESKPSQPTQAQAPAPSLPVPLPPVFSTSPQVQPAVVVEQPARAAWPTEPSAPAPTVTRLAWVDHQAPIRRTNLAQTSPETRAAAPAPASQWAGPVKYLSAAIHALRVEHSPTSALALLDRHASDLEKSSVSHEALLLRVEAMLKLERQGEVLKLLDATPMAGVAASRALLLTRGELRAAANRCAEAVSDFDLVLVQTQGRNKRALSGRAKCQKPTDGNAAAGSQDSDPR